METVLIQCPSCQAQVRVPGEFLGKRGRCNSCGKVFVLSEPGLEDSVAAWLNEEGAAAPAQAEVPAAIASSAKQIAALVGGGESEGAAIAQTRMPLRLGHVDQMGAFFIFPNELLFDSGFRSSMPRCCLSCGAGHSLTVHLVVWTSKLPDRDRLRLKSGEVRVRITDDQLVRLSGPELLAQLPNVPNMPPPYDLPMPYYVCIRCSPVGAVMTHVRPRSDGNEDCELGLGSLKRAAEFLARNVGRENPEYAKLLAEAEHRTSDPWRSLPLAVRNRIEQWYKAGENERFVSYVHDNDFARTEAGMGGLVMTNRRMIFHKFAAHREVPLTERLELRAQPQEGKYRLQISAPGAKSMVLHCDPSATDLIREALKKIGTQYTYKA